MRIKQWLKNIIILIPLFFSGKLLELDKLLLSIFAVITFSLLTSSIYLINDIVDYKDDIKHPSKKKRWLASGKISKLQAFSLSLLLFIFFVYLSLFWVKSEYFLLLGLIYWGLMILYTLFFKKLVIIDTIVISIGFVIRVVSGAVLLQLHLNSLLVISIISVALLISFGKRMMKLKFGGRESMREYLGEPRVFDIIIAFLASISFMSYILFAYFYDQTNLNWLIGSYLPPTYKHPKWLLITIPFAFYTLVRYIVLLYNNVIIDTPEDIWFRDKSLFISIISWISIAFVLIYSSSVFKM